MAMTPEMLAALAARGIGNPGGGPRAAAPSVLQVPMNRLAPTPNPMQIARASRLAGMDMHQQATARQARPMNKPVQDQPRRLIDRSTRGSKPFSEGELKSGYRKLK